MKLHYRKKTFSIVFASVLNLIPFLTDAGNLDNFSATGNRSFNVANPDSLVNVDIRNTRIIAAPNTSGSFVLNENDPPTRVTTIGWYQIDNYDDITARIVDLITVAHTGLHNDASVEKARNIISRMAENNDPLIFWQARRCSFAVMNPAPRETIRAERENCYTVDELTRLRDAYFQTARVYLRNLGQLP